jgi:beta-galactosidase
MEAVTANNHQFRVGGEVASLYGGAMHYWRLDRDKWSDILDKVKEMGFTAISTYIPWEVHEIEKGKFDFGTIDPRTDVDAFLTLVHSKGLRAIARPGPQINSELTWFGYPRRVLEDPELQALNAQGTKAVLTQVPRPIPALSYAADKFFDETASWYDAICPILARHVYPNGGLVAVQVDNEMAFFFHVNPYACDYSPAAVERYRAFLIRKYRDLETICAVYGKYHGSVAELEPPRRFEGSAKKDIPYYTDWIEYREHYLVDSQVRLAGMMKERGLAGIPMFHNYPHPLGPSGAVSGITTPFNIPALEEKLDFVGFDIYSRKELYDHVKTVVSYVVGTSRYPYIPEFIAGVWPWYLHPGGLADEEFVTKAALMHGIKGFSRYMLVERDRWLASPIRRDGRIRPDDCAMFRRANEVARKHRFVVLERQADVLLLAHREYDRLEAASVLVSFPGDFLESPLGFSEYPNFMTVSEEKLGFEEPVQLAKSAWFAQCYRSLTEAGCSFLISDTGLAPKQWRRYKALVVSSFEYMSGSSQRALRDYAEAGGTVVIGPRVPHLDERMCPDSTLAIGLATGRVVHLPTLGTNELELALAPLDLVRFWRNDARLDVAIHRSSDEPKSLLVYVANPTAEAIEAKVGVNTSLKSVAEIWSERSVPVKGQTWSDTLAAYTINMYKCEL